jgi:acetolactate synthase-1/2/3 large subunit
VRAEVGLLGDAGQGLQAILAGLPGKSREDWAQHSVARVNAAERGSWTAKQNVMQQMLDTLRDSLPAPIVVGDSTQPVYQGALGYRAPQANSWFNAGTGFGTLGYGLPAAIGAKLACPERPVVAVVGDGGVQFSSAELIAAREAQAGVIVVLWNNHCYAEIRDYMTAREIPPLGVDILPPDFAALARSCHVEHVPVRSLEQLKQVLAPLAGVTRPVLLELDAAAFLSA